jgi:hypothetical protein
MSYVEQTWIGDAVVAWRCYVVWQRNKAILATVVILVLATAITGYASIVTVHSSNIPFTEGLVSVMLATSLTTNFIISFLTAGRIWSVSRKIGHKVVRTTRSHYWKIIGLIIESGCVLVLAELVELVVFEAIIHDHSGQGPSGFVFIFYASVPQLLVGGALLLVLIFRLTLLRQGIMPILIVFQVNSPPTSQPDVEMGPEDVKSSWSAGSATVQFTTLQVQSFRPPGKTSVYFDRLEPTQ